MGALQAFRPLSFSELQDFQPLSSISRKRDISSKHKDVLVKILSDIMSPSQDMNSFGGQMKLEINITPEAVREIFRLLEIKEKEEKIEEIREERNEEKEKGIKEKEANKEANKEDIREEKEIYTESLAQANLPLEIAKIPRREEVIDYITKNNLYMDGNAFYDYYEKVGWKTKGGEPISDWRYACRCSAKRAYDSEERKRLGNPQISSKELKNMSNYLAAQKVIEEMRHPPVESLPEIESPRKEQ